MRIKLKTPEERTADLNKVLKKLRLSWLRTIHDLLWSGILMATVMTGVILITFIYSRLLDYLRYEADISVTSYHIVTKVIGLTILYWTIRLLVMNLIIPIVRKDFEKEEETKEKDTGAITS